MNESTTTTDRPVTRSLLAKTLANYSEGLADQLVGLLKKIVDGPRVGQRFDTLERRLAELEANALKGGAPWAKGTTYCTNTCVQHDGSLWRCVETHVAGAAFSHEHFILQVKRGRDGRDAR